MKNLLMIMLLVAGLAQTARGAAPVISGTGAAPVGDVWAQINWTTNQNANSVVEYGLMTSYGSTASDANSYTGHRVTLFGLTPSTTYHYRVRSTNSSSESSVSGDYTFTTGAKTYGCETNATGEPLGGGAGYSRIITPAQATVVVSTSAAFRSALSSAVSGTIIYVDDNAAIDLTGYTSLSIPAGVTIASGRGRNGSVGGLIYTTSFTSSSSVALFNMNGSGSRITGVRLAGPHNWTGRTAPLAHGIYVFKYWTEIDNCEMWGWNYDAIETRSGATGGLYVHHNYFHHNTRDGVGYPVCPSGASALIEGNIFDYYRHAVASSGDPGSSYEARYNLILEHAINHTLDMHGGADRGDGTDIAGTIIQIHHNTVRNLDQTAVCIRGIPEIGCWVNNNSFWRDYSTYVVRQINATGNMYVTDNQFGAPAAGTTGHAPTLTWTGEANYTSDGLNPQTGSATTEFVFRVKYSDADGDAPMAGYPKLHLLLNGAEFQYLSPVTMFPIDNTTPFATGRVYQCSARVPRGSSYTYYFEARDGANNAATGAATAAVAGPAVTEGNNPPVLYYTDNSSNYVENIIYPYSGTTSTYFDYRCIYLDIDNDPPADGYPKVKITNASGVEVPGSPFTMSPMNTNGFTVGRHYQLLKRLPASTTKYGCQIIASDAQGAGATAIRLSMYYYPTTVTYAGSMWTDITCNAPNPNPSMTFTVPVSFAQSVTDFASSDVSVTNGSVTGFSGSGAFYTLTITAAAQGQETTVTIPAGAATGNLASSTISRVCYPAGGADVIWVGHGYASAHYGTYTQPFDTMLDGLSWLRSGGTLNILAGSNPETIRITKPVRVQSSGGAARIGSE
ncbi:Ig-like domain-containing protein [bacterium]|nr:Ig-like domain-containing protein [bacterium]